MENNLNNANKKTIKVDPELLNSAKHKSRKKHKVKRLK